MTNDSSFEVEGKEACQNNKFKKAAKLFKQAREEFKEQGKFVKSAEMANNQSVSLLKAGKSKEALKAVLGTDEIFKREGKYLQQALAIGNRASALESLDQITEAEQAYEECIKLLSDLGEDQYISDVMKSLSDLKLKDKRHYEAAAALVSSVDLDEKPNLRQKISRFFLEKLFKRLN